MNAWRQTDACNERIAFSATTIVGYRLRRQLAHDNLDEVLFGCPELDVRLQIRIALRQTLGVVEELQRPRLPVDLEFDDALSEGPLRGSERRGGTLP